MSLYFVWSWLEMVSERSSFKEAEQFPKWIIIPVSYSFLERNDRIVCDSDVFGANSGATLCDIAETDPLMSLEIVYPVFNVQGMHLQRRGVNHMSRTCEFVVKRMFPQYMADILTKKTLDAFPELLDPVNIPLIDPPGSIGSIRRPRLELSDLFLYGIVNRNIRDEVPDGMGVLSLWVVTDDVMLIDISISSPTTVAKLAVICC